MTYIAFNYQSKLPDITNNMTCTMGVFANNKTIIAQPSIGKLIKRQIFLKSIMQQCFQPELFQEKISVSFLTWLSAKKLERNIIIRNIKPQSAIVTSTSTPGSMVMEVICFTTSGELWRSITRLCTRSSNLSHVLVPGSEMKISRQKPKRKKIKDKR